MSRFFKDIKKFFNYTVFSSKAELKSEVAGSFLSWLWWILDPFFFMLVYSFIAILVFKSGEPYFPVFVFIGLNCWQFFSKVVKSCVKVVQSKKMIVTKVYIPKHIFILEKIGVYGSFDDYLPSAFELAYVLGTADYGPFGGNHICLQYNYAPLRCIC